MGFGRVTKYWKVSLKDIKASPVLSAVASRSAEEEPLGLGKNGNDNASLIQFWDDSVEFASGKYRYEEHNLITNNCHAHVATSLNRLNFRGITYWNTLLIMIYLMIYSKFVRYA